MVIDSEENVRIRVLSQPNVVVLNSKVDCPVCEYYIPEVLSPIFEKKCYDNIEFYNIESDLLFPVDVRPRLFFFKDGVVQYFSTGSLPQYEVINLLERYYGKPI
jgi:hypothetical protein